MSQAGTKYGVDSSSKAHPTTTSSSWSRKGLFRGTAVGQRGRKMPLGRSVWGRMSHGGTTFSTGPPTTTSSSWSRGKLLRETTMGYGGRKMTLRLSVWGRVSHAGTSSILKSSSTAHPTTTSSSWSRAKIFKRNHCVKVDGRRFFSRSSCDRVSHAGTSFIVNSSSTAHPTTTNMFVVEEKICQGRTTVYQGGRKALLSRSV